MTAITGNDLVDATGALIALTILAGLIVWALIILTNTWRNNRRQRTTTITTDNAHFTEFDQGRTILSGGRRARIIEYHNPYRVTIRYRRTR